MSYEQIKKDIAAARHAQSVADHMLHTTYPVVNDPKLLIGIVESLEGIIIKSMTAVLQKERFYRKVPAFSQNPDNIVTTFAKHSEHRHTQTAHAMHTLNDIRTILQAKKDATMEFTKENKLVMASNSYQMKTLTPESVKTMLTKVKQVSNELLKLAEDKND